MEKGNRFRQAEKILKALANRRRLAIIRYLQQTGRATPGNIAEEIQLSFKATSKHLGVLYSAELVDREPFGLRVDYSLKTPIHGITKSALNSF